MFPVCAFRGTVADPSGISENHVLSDDSKCNIPSVLSAQPPECIVSDDTVCSGSLLNPSSRI